MINGFVGKRKDILPLLAKSESRTETRWIYLFSGPGVRSDDKFIYLCNCDNRKYNGWFADRTNAAIAYVYHDDYSMNDAARVGDIFWEGANSINDALAHIQAHGTAEILKLHDRAESLNLRRLGIQKSEPVEPVDAFLKAKISGWSSMAFGTTAFTPKWEKT